jgi:23S rRNA (adenine2503-C2)-methyltransferase
MKINKIYPLKTLMSAIRYYNRLTKRRVTFEYILLKDINDSLNDAKELALLIKGIFAYVNLIPYNEVKENGFKRSDKMQIKKFLNWLIELGVHARIRKEFGSDIDAACGQLKIKALSENEKKIFN